MQNYAQRERLGRGRSTVYRATRTADGASVALKRIDEWGLLTPAKQETALTEVAVLRSLSHPHVIPLLDAFTDAGDLCLVFPLVSPGARVFEARLLPLPPAAVARVGHQLASALAYLHGLAPQVLHRDVKPANLLLAAAPGGGGAAVPRDEPPSAAAAVALIASGTLLLGDFGSATTMRRALATGTSTGTPAFKSPEMLDQHEYGAPADVWALGATLLHLATGHLAGEALCAQRALRSGRWSLPAALAGEFHDTFESPAEAEEWAVAGAAQRAAWARLGAPLQGAIERCLALEPGARASAGELAAHAAFERERRAALLAGAVGRLEALLRSGGGGGGGVGGGPAPPPPSREELLAVLEAGAGVAPALLARACQLAVAAAEGAGEAWLGGACAALLGVLGGEGVAPECVGAAARALGALQAAGEGPREAARGGAAALLGAAERLAAENARLAAENAALAAAGERARPLLARDFFTRALRRLTAESFDVVKAELAGYPVGSHAEFEAVVQAVFDRALEDVAAQGLVARLCMELARPAVEVWGPRYLRVARLGEGEAPSGVAGWYYTTGPPGAPLAGWAGAPGETEEAKARASGLKLTSFKRAIMNLCERTFREGHSPLTLIGAHSIQHAIAKSRFLAAIAFTGQLFKEPSIQFRDASGEEASTGAFGSLRIIQFCCAALLRQGKLQEVDEGDVEGIVTLLGVCGRELCEAERAAEPGTKQMVPVFIDLLRTLSRFQHLSSISRLMASAKASMLQAAYGGVAAAEGSGELEFDDYPVPHQW